MNLQSSVSSVGFSVLLVGAGNDGWKGVEGTLAKEGFEVVRARTAKKAIELAIERRPDLILMEVRLPDTPGPQACHTLRQKGVDSLVMLLSEKALREECVIGLDSGADDFVVQPFSARELVARIRAHLRRRSSRYLGETSRYRIGSCVIDFDKSAAILGGTTRPLTTRELELLRFLIAHEGEILDRDTIFNRVWGTGSPASTRIVDSYIVKLRQKVEEDPVHPQRLLAIYGKGYMLSA